MNALIGKGGQREKNQYLWFRTLTTPLQIIKLELNLLQGTVRNAIIRGFEYENE